MQGGSLVTARRVFLGSKKLLFLVERRFITIFGVIDGFEDDSPSGWEYGVMDVEVIGLEGQSSKDRRDCDGLAIRKMDQARRHFKVKPSTL